MTEWGVLQDGARMLLGDPREMSMSYDRDAPADQLKAVFPAAGLWGDLVQVLVYEGGEAVFRGIVDEQNTRLEADGIWVELVCRSLEALLLDNEACPGTIRKPSLGVLGKKLLAPLGFSQVKGPEGSFPGQIEIEKGTSCWQALSGFCSRYLGTAPYVDAQGALCCQGQEEKEIQLEGVLWAEISRRPCKEISEVWMQSFHGAYDTLYREPLATAVRRRYGGRGANPREMLRRARAASYRVTLECPGVLWPLRGRVVSAELPRLGELTGCPVVSARCYRDSRGLRTRLTLERGEKEDDYVADETTGKAWGPASS